MEIKHPEQTNEIKFEVEDGTEEDEELHISRKGLLRALTGYRPKARRPNFAWGMPSIPTNVSLGPPVTSNNNVLIPTNIFFFKTHLRTRRSKENPRGRLRTVHLTALTLNDTTRVDAKDGEDKEQEYVATEVTTEHSRKGLLRASQGYRPEARRPNYARGVPSTPAKVNCATPVLSVFINIAFNNPVPHYDNSGAVEDDSRVQLDMPDPDQDQAEDAEDAEREDEPSRKGLLRASQGYRPEARRPNYARGVPSTQVKVNLATPVLNVNININSVFINPVQHYANCGELEDDSRAQLDTSDLDLDQSQAEDSGDTDEEEDEGVEVDGERPDSMTPPVGTQQLKLLKKEAERINSARTTSRKLSQQTQQTRSLLAEPRGMCVRCYRAGHNTTPAPPPATAGIAPLPTLLMLSFMTKTITNTVNGAKEGIVIPSLKKKKDMDKKSSKSYKVVTVKSKTIQVKTSDEMVRVNIHSIMSTSSISIPQAATGDSEITHEKNTLEEFADLASEAGRAKESSDHSKSFEELCDVAETELKKFTEKISTFMKEDVGAKSSAEPIEEKEDENNGMENSEEEPKGADKEVDSPKHAPTENLPPSDLGTSAKAVQGPSTSAKKRTLAQKQAEVMEESYRKAEKSSSAQPSPSPSTSPSPSGIQVVFAPGARMRRVLLPMKKQSNLVAGSNMDSGAGGQNWPANNADNVNHGEDEVVMKKMGNKENFVYLVKRE